jgi:cytochrome c-type biogenesis protein CcmH/NrfF
VIAHAGHWIEQVLFLAPTVAIVLWIAFIALRDRRRSREGPRDG